jgi:hypothetical protein
MGCRVFDGYEHVFKQERMKAIRKNVTFDI